MPTGVSLGPIRTKKAKRRSSMATIEMVPRHALSFGEFVRLSDQQRKSLGQITIIPPQLGSPGFGCVVAEKPIFVLRGSKTLSVKKRTRKRATKRSRR
jgi:hypothetical protein